MNDVTVGSILRTFRRRRRWTQKELARRSEVSPGYLGLLELDSRHPERDKLLQLCRALDLTVEETDSILLSAGYSPSSEGAKKVLESHLKLQPSAPIQPQLETEASFEVAVADTGKLSDRPIAPEVLKPLGPFITTDGKFGMTICREHHADRNFLLIQDLTKKAENLKITLVSNGPNRQLVAQGYITNGYLALSVNCEIKLPLSWSIKTENQETSKGEAP